TAGRWTRTTFRTRRTSEPMRILVIDNYDSFVYNLVQYLGQLGADCEVRRNDEITVAGVERLRPDGVLLSPGPGTPERAGVCLDLVEAYAGRVPILGVCLGHQVIGHAYGGTVDRARELLHGKTSQVTHNGAGGLAGRPDPCTPRSAPTSRVPPVAPHRRRGARRAVLPVPRHGLPIAGQTVGHSALVDRGDQPPLPRTQQDGATASESGISAASVPP